jgi:hypothetical protein
MKPETWAGRKGASGRILCRLDAAFQKIFVKSQKFSTVLSKSAKVQRPWDIETLNRRETT